MPDTRHLSVLSLTLTGFVLGWSVAWPPGPVNAEIVRRGLTRGFWAAYGMALGGCVGDAVWALLAAMGARVVLPHDAARTAFWVPSSGLLIVLGVHYIRGAARTWSIRRGGGELAFVRPARFDGGRVGFLLGLALTLTSPWSIAFWLAVMGRPELARHGLVGALVVAVSVIAGAATWAFILSGAVVLLRSRFSSPWWDIFTRAATGLLLLYFAFRSLVS